MRLDDSLTYRGDAARTGVVAGPGPGARMTLAFKHTLPDQIVTSPAIVNGVAYVGSLDGRLRAFDLGQGSETWSTDVNVAWSSPSVARDLVIVGTEDRDLVAIHRETGKLAWRLPLDAFAAGSPAVFGDHLFVSTSSASSRGRAVAGATGKVMALDAATQRVVWQEDLPGPSTRSIAVTDSILVVPTDVGIAVAFDTATGRELWRFSTESFTDTPVIAGDKVFLAGLDPEGTRGTLWAVDLKSGQPLWHHTRPSRQTIVAPAVDPATGIVYAGTVDGDVIALRADDGSSGLDAPSRRRDRCLADQGRRPDLRGVHRRHHGTRRRHRSGPRYGARRWHPGFARDRRWVLGRRDPERDALCARRWRLRACRQSRAQHPRPFLSSRHRPRSSRRSHRSSRHGNGRQGI